MRTSLTDGFYLPVRGVLAAGKPLPVAWYGQQEASWIAYYDAVRRLGLARFGAANAQHLDDWATLARSCGWWWPGEDVCVGVERPAVVQTEPVPGGWYEQIRLRRGSRPAVEYRDGFRPPLGSWTAAAAVTAKDRVRNSLSTAVGAGHTRPGLVEVPV